MLAKNIMLFAPEKVLKPTCKGRRDGPVYMLEIFVIFQISITHQHLFTKHNQYSAPGANLVPVMLLSHCTCHNTMIVVGR